MPTRSPDLEPLVLLVDDDEDNRDMYSEYLTADAGYRVAQASDGEAAIDRAVELQPDVIVMDLSLPVLDGREAMRRLRLDPRTSAIPIVALTGYANVQASGDPRVGFSAVLVKPCLPEALLGAIQVLTRRGGG